MSTTTTAPSTEAAPPGGWVRSAQARLVAPLKTWPLTWRLIAVLVVLLFTALTLTTAATQVVLRSFLLDRTAAELRAAGSQASSIPLSAIITRDHVPTLTMPSSYAIVFMSPTGGETFPFISADEATRPSIPTMSVTDPRVASGQPFTVRSLGGDGTWLVHAGRLDDGSGLYAIAMPLRGIDDTLTDLLARSLGIGLLITAVCAAVGYAGITRAFRPLRQIEDTASAIADGELGRRIPEHAAQDEVASLSHSLNAMLAQIEGSFAVREASEERMRRFVTDASHELRTPLATIRGYAELYRQGAASSPEATAGAMRRIEDEATRMSGLVEDLLTLARLDNRRPMSVSDVDLTVLAGDAVQDAKAREPERPLRLIGLGDTGLGPALVRGDEARLRQVMTNLVANALQHTPAGSPVEVAVGRATPGNGGWLGGPGAGSVSRAPSPSARPGGGAGTTYRLEVRDHGQGIAQADVDRVFQRFYRGDPSRGRASGGGSGLGLAIVMAIVTAHGGRVGVRATPGGGATFVVEVPSTPPPPAPSVGAPSPAPSRRARPRIHRRTM